MESQNYHAVIRVKSTPEEAFAKITQIANWWKKDFSGQAGKLNSSFRVPFSEESYVDFKVTEAIPHTKLTWSVTDCFLPWFQNKKEWNGTHVVWEIAPEHDATHITMTHVGLVPEVECYEACEAGWNGHVKTSLLLFINENRGQPK
jgi:hypothetical protein